jgi:formiminotetrahydrofolate cyclodeaminase
MNQKSRRSNVRAPTQQPDTSISNAAALPVDGDSALSASHDVLQAAMAAPADAPSDVAADAKPAKKNAKAVADEPVEAPPVKAAKVPKIKFVKRTFSLPESEAALLDAMKKTHQANGLALKKSQLLRAALLALADVDAERLAQLVAHLPAVTVARKKKK